MAQWWEEATFCQIAPRSYQDSNGDGVGDLNGLRQRLDHLSWLGIDAVWLCPIQPTPNRDFGYDISDFCEVDPELGTLDDFWKLLDELHDRGMRLILDFVPNHTAQEHPWFAESRSSRSSAKRDFYVWRDPAPDGGPPNKWLSRFGGSAWEYDAASGQYYYHAFLKEQPDLNWRNRSVRAAMHDVLRFWLRRGVDGFRIDAGAVLVEDDLLRDDPPNPDAEKAPPPERYRRVFSDNRPETLDYLADIRAVVDEFLEVVLLAEVQTGPGQLRRFFGDERPVLHMPLNYVLLDAHWSSAGLAAAVDAYLREIPDVAKPNWVIGSHDKRRVAEEVGPQLRNAALLLFTLPGPRLFYAGDEIGMPDVSVPEDRVTDPFPKLVPGFGLGRDPHRTPMRWDRGPHFGFTTGEPWLPMGGLDFPVVSDQRKEPGSVLALYRALIALRRAEPVLAHGRHVPCSLQGEVYIFDRVTDDGRLTIAVNTAEHAQKLRGGRGEVILSTHLDRTGPSAGDIVLRPHEGIILRPM